MEGQTEVVEKEARLAAGLFQEVKQLQELGIVDSRFSPVVFLTQVIGPIHFWLRYRDQFKTILNLDGNPDDLDVLFLRQLTQLVMEMSRKKT